MNSLIGQQLGQYKLVEQIGQGTMGTVFKARQLGLDRWVALKLLPPHYAADPEFRQRFLQEAKTIARLEHPHILPVYDFGQQNGYTYLVMLYIDHSRTLADVMARPISLEQALDYLDQIAAALDHAHRHGVIHRDVKPANILLRDGWVFLADFGLVRMLEGASQLSSTSAGAGTPAYMSPEQGSGGKIDTRTDIYALGVIAYEMLTGQVPHLADNAQALIYRRNHEPPPSLRELRPNIPPAVDLAIQKALALQPARRFQTAGAFVTALRGAMASDGESRAIKTVPRFKTPVTPSPAPAPIPAPPPAPERVERQPRLAPEKAEGPRLPWLWLLAGGLGALVLILSLISILIFTSRSAAEPLPGAIPTLPASEMLFFDDFSGLNLDRQKWQLVTGSGQLQVSNSELHLASQGRSFPLLSPAGDPLPSEGNFSLKIALQYRDTGEQGTGFWLGTRSQPLFGVTLTEEALIEGRAVSVWQDEDEWRVLVGEDGQEVYRANAPHLEPHELTVNYIAETYQVLVDGREVYVSSPGQSRPNSFWLGNPLVMNESTTWSSLEVDRVSVEALAETALPGPTSTPVVTPSPLASPTETPTPVPPTPTPESTATPAPSTGDCSIPVADTFKAGWNRARDLLGCPAGEFKIIPTLAEESFEGGHTLWRSDTDQVYIIYDRSRQSGEELFEGQWQRVPPEWRWDGSNPEGIGLSPPPGRVEPQRGFGWLWRTHLGGPQGPLGWALDREYGFDNIGQVQQFEQGLMFKGSGPKIYVLLDSGKFYAAQP